MKKILSFITVIFLISSMLLLSGCYFTKSHDDVKIAQESLNYLCEKYNANADEFELIDYQAPHIGWVPIGELIDKPKFVDYSFQYKYNEREFFVFKEKGKFYDDYQLEDVQKWCTSLLQENADNRIIGVWMETSDIINYCKANNNTVITKENAKDFLISLEKCWVYFFVDDNNSHYYKPVVIKDEVKKAVKSYINQNDILVSYLTDEKMVVTVYKMDTGWVRYITDE